MVFDPSAPRSTTPASSTIEGPIPAAPTFAQPLTRALASALLLSLLAHALLLLWLLDRWPRAPLPQNSGVWSVTLERSTTTPTTQAEVPPEPPPAEPTAPRERPQASEREADHATVVPASTDSPQTTRRRPLDLRLPESTLSSEPSNEGQEAIFDRRLRGHFLKESADSDRPQPPAEVSTWVDQSGRERVINGDRCAEVMPAFDHQSTAVMTLPTRCAWLKSDSERFGDALKQRLRQRRPEPGR